MQKVLGWQVNLWTTHRPLVLSSFSVCSFVTERQSTNYKFVEFLNLPESTFKAPRVFSEKNRKMPFNIILVHSMAFPS